MIIFFWWCFHLIFKIRKCVCLLYWKSEVFSKNTFSIPVKQHQRKQNPTNQNTFLLSQRIKTNEQQNVKKIRDFKEKSKISWHPHRTLSLSCNLKSVVAKGVWVLFELTAVVLSSTLLWIKPHHFICIL